MSATSLAHVNMAENEAKKKPKTDSVESIVLPETPKSEFTRESTAPYNVLFKLVKKKRGRTNLDNCADNVINPATKRPERIWLLNGANSIWDTELENILKDKNRYERARRGRDIIFVDGVLRVKSTDTIMLEFMRLNPHNVGSNRSGAGKYDYYEYNPQQEQQERHAKQLLKIEMILKVKEMPMEKVKRIASFLGIVFVDELGEPKSEEGIKTDLMVYVDNNAATFQRYVDSKEVDVHYMIKKAILDAKIDLGSGTNNVTWSQGRGFICKIPITRKPLEYLTELAMTNSEEGRLFKEQLEQIMK